MITIADKNNKAELLIVDYEFSQPQIAEDADWVTLSIDITTPQGTWHEQSPCLRIPELQRLSAWLQSLTDNAPSQDSITFTEPTVAFKIIKRTPTTIFLQLEVTASDKPFVYANKLSVVFELSFDEVKGIALQIHQDLDKFLSTKKNILYPN